MRSRDSLLLALAAAVIGAGAGFLGGALLQGPRTAAASGALVATPSAAPTRTPANDERMPEVRSDAAQPERETAVAALAAPVPQVSQAELERAVAAFDEPTVGAVLGAGTIRGEVLDEAGLPLAGAVVIGTPTESLRTNDPGKVGGAAPRESSLEDHLRESAKSWAKTHGLSRRAVSGADGRFELSGLDESRSHRLTAFLDGHVLEPASPAHAVSVGQRMDFRAEAVHQVPVRLVYEHGGQPSEGVVGVKRGDEERLYTWSSAAPVLRLTPGRVELRGYADVRRAEGGRSEVDADHASKALAVEVADQAGATIELALEPRVGIRGRVVDEHGATDGRQMVRLLALGSDGEVDEEALAESRRYARLNGDRFHLLDLTPGLYALGLSDWNNALIAQQVVRVEVGVVEVELAVPEPDPDQHLIVRAFGPSGRPLRDLEFRWEQRSGGGSSSGSLQGRRDADGSYWLRPKPEFFGAWGKQTTYVLKVVHDELGEREVELAQGQREVQVTFEEPVTLVVVVPGYAGSGYVGKLRVAVEPAVEGQSEEQRRQHGYRMHENGQDPFSPEGVARIDGLAPGRWKLDLMVQVGDWETRSARTVEVLATHGELTVNMELPALYDLAVLVPGWPEGGYLFLTKASGEEAGAALFDGSSHAQVGPDGRALFRGLAAGDYVLRANGSPETLEVTLPCAEVRFEATQPDCLRVAIADTEGSMYKAGLRAGDLILSVGGAEIDAQSNYFMSMLGSGTVELSVLREGKTLAIELPRIANGADWWGTLGGMLSPATRP